MHWIENARFDRVVWLNMGSYFFFMWVFGALLWKCFAIAIAVAIFTKAHYGRRLLTKVGILAVMVAMLEWSEILPPAKQLFSRISTLFATHTL